MKKIIPSVIAVIACAAILTGCSPNHGGKQDVQASTNALSMYTAPNAHSAVVGQITPQNQAIYVPIFVKGDWYEVMNATTGQVGWVKPPRGNNANAAQTQQSLVQMQQEAYEIQQQFIDDVRMLQQQQHQMMATINPASAQQYQSTSISYQANGSAQVQQTWKDAQGKLQTKTYTIPANKMNQFTIVNGQVVTS